MLAEIASRYIFDLDGYQVGNPPSGLEKIDPRLAMTAAAAAERSKVLDLTDGELYSAYSSECVRLRSSALADAAAAVDAFHYGVSQ